jgi:hypothetical protein
MARQEGICVCITNLYMKVCIYSIVRIFLYRYRRMMPRPAEQRMHATLLAQPATWARFTEARCAPTCTDFDGGQQRA